MRILKFLLFISFFVFVGSVAAVQLPAPIAYGYSQPSGFFVGAYYDNPAPLGVVNHWIVRDCNNNILSANVPSFDYSSGGYSAVWFNDAIYGDYLVSVVSGQTYCVSITAMDNDGVESLPATYTQYYGCAYDSFFMCPDSPTCIAAGGAWNVRPVYAPVAGAYMPSGELQWCDYYQLCNALPPAVSYAINPVTSMITYNILSPYSDNSAVAWIYSYTVLDSNLSTIAGRHCGGQYYLCPGGYTYSESLQPGVSVDRYFTSIELLWADSYDHYSLNTHLNCSWEHLDLCRNSADCVGAGGNWYNNSCIDHNVISVNMKNRRFDSRKTSYFKFAIVRSDTLIQNWSAVNISWTYIDKTVPFNTDAVINFDVPIVNHFRQGDIFGIWMIEQDYPFEPYYACSQMNCSGQNYISSCIFLYNQSTWSGQSDNPVTYRNGYIFDNSMLHCVSGLICNGDYGWQYLSFTSLCDVSGITCRSGSNSVLSGIGKKSSGVGKFTTAIRHGSSGVGGYEIHY